MKTKPTFRAHARSRRARRKLMNFTGDGDRAASQAIKAYQDKDEKSDKTADDGWLKRFGRNLVKVQPELDPAELWVQQAKALAGQEGISVDQAAQMMQQEGMTPSTLLRTIKETDVGDRTALTQGVKGWMNPLFNPLMYPGYHVGSSAIDASTSPGSNAGMYGNFGLMGASLAGPRIARRLLGQVGPKAVSKYLLPLYMGARTAVDPQGLRGIAESAVTGKAPEYNRILQAQAMKDVMEGRKIQDTAFGSGMEQRGGAALHPVSYLHDILPIEGLWGHDYKTWMDEQKAKGQSIGEREAIRGRITAADILSGTGAISMPLKLYSKHMLGDVAGYDPFYRQRGAAETAARRMDEQRRKMYRSGIAETSTDMLDPEARSNRLWLSQMKRQQELSPFGASGAWSRDMLQPSYKATDEAQTTVDPSVSRWERSLSDAREIAKRRGMTLEQVLAGRDVRVKEQEQQMADSIRNDIAKIQSGDTSGMDPQRVAKLQKWMGAIQAQGNPLDDEAIRSYAGGQLKAQELAKGTLQSADEGRDRGYSWWRSQLASGKGYSPYESLSSRAKTQAGFDKRLFDELYTPEVLEKIKGTRGYQHAQSGLKGGFSRAQLEQFLADKDPYELQRLYGMNARAMRDMHSAGRQSYVSATNLAEDINTRGKGYLQGPQFTADLTKKPQLPEIPRAAGTRTYKASPQKKNVQIPTVPQNASGMGDGSRV